MKFDVSHWGGCGMDNTYLNFELPHFNLFFLFVHNHCERTAGSIGTKFGMNTWGGCGMVIT